jgi:hypothetical protein
VIEDKLTLQWLLDRAEDDGGGCLVWTGSANNGKEPRTMLAGQRILVRKEIWLLAHEGCTPPAGAFFGVNCRTPKCVHPDHVVARTRQQALKGCARNPDAALRATLTIRAKSKLQQDRVDMILADERPATQVAPEHGISAAMVNFIRAGKMRRPIGGLFSGLMR